MIWADIYLICFIVGFSLSAVSFLLGSFHMHLPGVHLHDGFHLHFDHFGAHAGGLQAAGGHHGPLDADQISFFNFASITAFLAWFGGTGYLLTRYSNLWVGLVLLAATGLGLVGAAIIFWFLAKVLLAHERPLDAADYEMIGVLGRITVPIRPGGTGELLFSQEGTRRCSGARSDNGSAIPKGTEVVVTGYERGIAYVRRWEELANDDILGPGKPVQGSKEA